jgi:hypothetical protein
MRLISWKRLGIIASLVWVAVGPTHFQEDNARRIAGDRYQLCIKQDWARKGGVERCNKEFRQALSIAYWSSWAQLAFIPMVLAWFAGWVVFSLVRKVRSRPKAGSRLCKEPKSMRTAKGISMVEQLQSVPACQLNVSEEQYGAIGHVSLQWAFLEGEIDGNQFGSTNGAMSP